MVDRVPSRADLIAVVMDGDPFLTGDEVAALFRVDPRTVSRWARTGRLPGTRTPGAGHGVWRFRRSVVRQALMDDETVGEGSTDGEQGQH
jgi:excisionase family DNA binding protein